MIINKAYIYLKDKKSEFLIEEIIRSSFENVEISVENDVLAVSTIDDSAFQLKLTKINKLVMSDFNIKVSFLIVPYFDEIFKKYLLKINGGVFTVFEIFLRNINEIVLGTKKAKVLTTHPEDSYTVVEGGDGMLTLKILDSTKFWSVTRYLVVRAG